MKQPRTAERSILEERAARVLLADAEIQPQDVRGCRGRLTRFLRGYLPLFYRREQRDNAVIVVEGLLSGLERKTAEPIALDHGVQRKPIQFFVGAGKWDDEAVMAQLRQHVSQEMGDPDAVLVLDPSAFPKKGTHSCGVKRTWCGRLGKVENCQVGLFLAYATSRGQAPLDRRLYLPEDWASDAKRREESHVPPEVKFQERWRMGLDMLDAHRGRMPHRWIAADDEFGRVNEFRAGLRLRGERYVVDVPCTTPVRDLEARRPPRKKGKQTRRREVPFCRVDQWTAKQPSSRWQRIEVKDGEKGPIMVSAMTTRVRTKIEGRLGPEERLVVIRRVEGDGSEPELSYHLSNAEADVPLEKLVRVRGRRHQVEQMFEHGKGEAGLDHYEVRSWVGWHHHMTLSLLALWFLCLERLTIGEKNTGGDGAAGARDRVAFAA
jgi:SRSO17 transposase